MDELSLLSLDVKDFKNKKSNSVRKLSERLHEQKKKPKNIIAMTV